MSRRAFGAQWERRAESWLQHRGLQPIARNFQCRLGELDLVMRDRNTVVFIEVRFRGPGSWASGRESVTPVKQQRLSRAAGLFLNRHPALARHPCRFDVVAFEQGAFEPRTQWIRNAFESTLS